MLRDSLDLAELMFQGCGRRNETAAYAPGDLLKLYIYGYLYRIRASVGLKPRRHRNVQVMWLIKRLTPGSRPIADFRKDHARSMRGVCRVIAFAGSNSLFGAELLAIDGTKIAAGGKPQAGITPAKIAKMNAAIDRKIADIWLRWTEAGGRSESGRAQPMWRRRLQPSGPKARLQSQAENWRARPQATG